MLILIFFPPNSLLLQAGSQVNAQDFDGWTPLHAAAHWGQREACEMLALDRLAAMEIKNYVGQTCFDVADPDVLRLLEDLKRKQATLTKDRPEMRNLINRPNAATNASAAAAVAAAAAAGAATGKRR